MYIIEMFLVAVRPSRVWRTEYNPVSCLCYAAYITKNWRLKNGNQIYRSTAMVTKYCSRNWFIDTFQILSCIMVMGVLWNFLHYFQFYWWGKCRIVLYNSHVHCTGEGWFPINRFNTATYLYLSQDKTWIYICRGLFCIQWVLVRGLFVLLILVD